MTTAEARNAAKARLDIDSSDTAFDATIDQFVTDNLKRLWPKCGREVAVQTKTVSPSDYGEATIDLSTLTTPVAGFRLIEASDGAGEYPIGQVFQHGTSVRVRGLNSNVNKLYVYGLDKYTLTNLAVELERGLVLYVISDFYNFLIGNKRRYNEYMQNGRPAVENMQDLADKFELDAEAYIDSKAVLYGRQ